MLFKKCRRLIQTKTIAHTGHVWNQIPPGACWDGITRKGILFYTHWKFQINTPRSMCLREHMTNNSNMIYSVSAWKWERQVLSPPGVGATCHGPIGLSLRWDLQRNIGPNGWPVLLTPGSKFSVLKIHSKSYMEIEISTRDSLSL